MGDRKGIWPIKKVGFWFVDGDDLTVACLIHSVSIKMCQFYQARTSFDVVCQNHQKLSVPVKTTASQSWYVFIETQCTPVVITTSKILSCNKIKNGDILLPVNPGLPGKMAVKTDKEMERITVIIKLRT